MARWEGFRKCPGCGYDFATGEGERSCSWGVDRQPAGPRLRLRTRSRTTLRPEAGRTGRRGTGVWAVRSARVATNSRNGRPVKTLEEPRSLPWAIEPHAYVSSYRLAHRWCPASKDPAAGRHIRPARTHGPSSVSCSVTSPVGTPRARRSPRCTTSRAGACPAVRAARGVHGPASFLEPAEEFFGFLSGAHGGGTSDGVHPVDGFRDDNILPPRRSCTAPPALLATASPSSSHERVLLVRLECSGDPIYKPFHACLRYTV